MARLILCCYNAQEYSRAATCRDFACEIREILGLFCATPENRFKIWLKRSQSSLTSMMKQKAY
jgi:hypothetical protein